MEEELELNESNVDYLFEKCLYNFDSKELNFSMPVIDAAGQVEFDGFKILNNSKRITGLLFQLMDTGDEKQYSMFGLTSGGIIWTEDPERISKFILLAVANGDIERIREKIDPNFGPKYRVKRKNPDMVDLTSENLINVYNECFSENEGLNVIIVDGVNNSFAFNKDKVEMNKKKIKNLIAQIGDIESIISFHNLAYKRNGDKWSTDDLDIEILIGLGLAAGYIEFDTPRKNWNKDSKNNIDVLFTNPKSKRLDPHIN